MVRATMKDGRLSNAPGARSVDLTNEDYRRLRQLQEIEAAEEAAAARVSLSMLPWVPDWLKYWAPFVLAAVLGLLLVVWLAGDYYERIAACERKFHGHGVLVRRSGLQGGTVCVRAEPDE